MFSDKTRNIRQTLSYKTYSGSRGDEGNMMKLLFILVGTLLLSDVLQGSLAGFDYANVVAMTDYLWASVLAVVITPWVNTQFD